MGGQIKGQAKKKGGGKEVVSEERGRRWIRWEKAGKAEEKGGSRQGVRAERRKEKNTEDARVLCSHV